jgi:hypothetical protein
MQLGRLASGSEEQKAGDSKWDGQSMFMAAAKIPRDHTFGGGALV